MLKPLGCLGSLGTVLSLGLMPVVRRWHERQYPQALSGAQMRLRNGEVIPWSAILRVRKSDTYLADRYLFTQFTIWHSAGRATFPTHRLIDADAVIQFISAHLPHGVPIEAGSPTVLRGYRRF